MSVKYLQTEKSGMLSYRRKFPKGLVRFISSASPTGRGRTELKVSLGAKDLDAPQARERYRAAEADYDAIVSAAERSRATELKRLSGHFDVLDARTISYLASMVTHESLWVDEEVRLEQEPSERKRSRAAKLTEGCLADLAEYRELRGVGDVEALLNMWGDEAVSLAEFEGLNLDRASLSFRVLCNAIHDAQIVALEGLLSRLAGDLVPTPSFPLPLARFKSRSETEGRIGLVELFERYASEPGRHPKTIAQWRPYIGHLAKFVPDDDVSAITHENIVAWRNHLRDNEAYRGRRLSAKTINGSYLGAVSALLAWAKGDGIIARNPMLEVSKVRLPAKAMTRRKAFTADEANTILKASLAPSVSREGVHLRTAKRWCPWLMAYSGARVNEVTQLRKEDIYEEDGVLVMRLMPDAGTIKSKAYRLVPLHSHLLAQGFLEWVQGRPEGPLFFDPEKRRSDHAINRQANRLGSKLAEWVRAMGIEGVMPNHGWRHLFISQAARFQMDPRTTKAITGHSSSDVHEKTYQDEYVDVMAREIEKVPQFLVNIEGEVAGS